MEGDTPFVPVYKITETVTLDKVIEQLPRRA